MIEEKRRFKRSKGGENAFAAFTSPCELINVGRILDISMGGLCVRYVTAGEVCDERCAIKVFGSNDRFIHVEKIKCRIVYDHLIPEASWEKVGARVCGVEFLEMSEDQTSLLREFIDYFALENTQN
jgi:c-di-GMP-binding flagellar brake protein YcgR